MRRGASRGRPWRAYAAVLLALSLLLAGPGRAAAEDAAPVPAWSYTLYKTLSYELLASAADGVYYATMMGDGHPLAFGLFTSASIAISAATYYLHELAWNVYGPSPEEYAEAPLRVGLLKTAGYRVMASARSFALGYAFTGDPLLSAGFALASNLYDPLIYVANEYVWTMHGPAVEH